MSELHHECGVAGLYYLPGGGKSTIIPQGQERAVSRLIPRMLLDLQNRGQLAAGLSTFDRYRDSLILTHKDIGTVTEAFRMSHTDEFHSILAAHQGPAAIGHVRYATCGASCRELAQPMERVHGCKWKWFTLAFNGHLANVEELAKPLRDNEDYHLSREESDTEVLVHHFSFALRKGRPPLGQLFSEIAQKIDGSYCLLWMNAMGDMVALRDPLGLRPLCMAQDGPLIGFASESVALVNRGFTNIRSLKPGEMVIIEDGEVRSEFLPRPDKPKHCFFEWIYFANVASVLDDISVYQARAALGRALAAREPKPDSNTIVVPVPDTAKAAADAMAYELQCPSVEGLIRNRYIGRTFIERIDREEKVRSKFTPLREVLRNKRVLLVEDSIVRSTTLRVLLKHIREIGGAAEIHVRVACPPIIAPCFYGIDMSSVDELFAPDFMRGSSELTAEMERDMARELEADSLRYLRVEDLSEAIGLPADHLCNACVTGKYPTPKGQQLFQIDSQRYRGNAR